MRHLIVGTNTSPRDQTSLIAGIDERLHRHSASTNSASSTTEGMTVASLLAYDLGYALVKFLFCVARSLTVVSERSVRRHRYG